MGATYSPIIAFCLVCFLAAVKAQYGFVGDFGSFRGFGGGLDTPLQSIRDPRENTGPVVFPPAPPDNGETSGVVVGASGYGFVPPHTSVTVRVVGFQLDKLNLIKNMDEKLIDALEYMKFYITIKVVIQGKFHKFIFNQLEGSVLFTLLIAAEIIR
ncbi:hypothetical protein NQ317_018640 [Molorchus minor]|uniref:Uncharacterized protein n=1 Tax=Molorchus minor TaxID=1323400 RepID=A0ABQ9JV96_9CUCU|nr:hypothetical protein NQ317_018640 [Molorchus minor]